MGYTTDFEGKFNLNPPLTGGQAQYLKQFSEIRHMARDINRLSCGGACLHSVVGLPLGDEGQFFVGDSQGSLWDNWGDPSILDYNDPPEGQPGLWCSWEPDADGEALEWSGMEKFYCYTEWLEWIITYILTPWGIQVNGDVEWRGEDSSDIGVLSVKDSVITIHDGTTISTMAQIQEVKDLAAKPKFFSNENYRVTTEGDTVWVEPKGAIAKALTLGMMILEGDMILETRGGRTATVKAEFNFLGDLTGVRLDIN